MPNDALQIQFPPIAAPQITDPEHLPNKNVTSQHAHTKGPYKSPLKLNEISKKDPLPPAYYLAVKDGRETAYQLPPKSDKIGPVKLVNNEIVITPMNNMGGLTEAGYSQVRLCVPIHTPNGARMNEELRNTSFSSPLGLYRIGDRGPETHIIAPPALTRSDGRRRYSVPLHTKTNEQIVGKITKIANNVITINNANEHASLTIPFAVFERLTFPKKEGTDMQLGQPISMSTNDNGMLSLTVPKEKLRSPRSRTAPHTTELSKGVPPKATFGQASQFQSSAWPPPTTARASVIKAPITTVPTTGKQGPVALLCQKLQLLQL